MEKSLLVDWISFRSIAVHLTFASRLDDPKGVALPDSSAVKMVGDMLRRTTISSFSSIPRRLECRSAAATLVLHRIFALHVHRLAAVRKVEVLGLLLGTETKVTILSLLRSELIDIVAAFFIVGEVLLNDVVRLHVDLLVRVVLAIVDLLHAADFLDEESISVDWLTGGLGCFLVHLSYLENILEAIESNLNDLVIGTSEEIAKRLDATALHKVSNLLRLLESTRSGV